mgnify:CR=1 FL=1
MLFANSVKGISALKLSRDLGVAYKSAWVLAHKLRESLLDDKHKDKFKGIVEMDGVYVNVYIRPKNHKHKRIDRRKAHKPNKRVIISLRQRHTHKGQGAKAARTFVLKSENNKDINSIALKNIALNTQIHADENVAYDDLAFCYDLQRVNHQLEFSGLNGENNNQSEVITLDFVECFTDRCIDLECFICQTMQMRLLIGKIQGERTIKVYLMIY